VPRSPSLVARRTEVRLPGVLTKVGVPGRAEGPSTDTPLSQFNRRPLARFAESLLILGVGFNFTLAEVTYAVIHAQPRTSALKTR
jgi:broad specificity phosphatase PhoE